MSELCLWLCFILLLTSNLKSAYQKWRVKKKSEIIEENHHQHCYYSVHRKHFFKLFLNFCYYICLFTNKRLFFLTKWKLLMQYIICYSVVRMIWRKSQVSSKLLKIDLVKLGNGKQVCLKCRSLNTIIL